MGCKWLNPGVTAEPGCSGHCCPGWLCSWPQLIEWTRTPELTTTRLPLEFPVSLRDTCQSLLGSWTGMWWTPCNVGGGCGRERSEHKVAEEKPGMWRDRTREKVEGTEIRVKRARWQEGRRPAHEKLPELLIPLQFLILTLLRIPTHSLLLIPSRKYLWILIPQSLYLLSLFFFFNLLYNFGCAWS